MLSPLTQIPLLPRASFQSSFSSSGYAVSREIRTAPTAFGRGRAGRPWAIIEIMALRDLESLQRAAEHLTPDEQIQLAEFLIARARRERHGVKKVDLSPFYG